MKLFLIILVWVATAALCFGLADWHRSEMDQRLWETQYSALKADALRQRTEAVALAAAKAKAECAPPAPVFDHVGQYPPAPLEQKRSAPIAAPPRPHHRPTIGKCTTVWDVVSRKEKKTCRAS